MEIKKKGDEKRMFVQSVNQQSGCFNPNKRGGMMTGGAGEIRI